MRTITFCSLRTFDRADQMLRAILPAHSRSFFQDLIGKNQVKIGGKACESDSRVHERDEISVNIPDLKEIGLVGSDIPLVIVYEDDDLLVIDKPAGMVVHPTDNGGHLDDTLVNAVIHHCSQQSPLPPLSRGHSKLNSKEKTLLSYGHFSQSRAKGGELLSSLSIKSELRPGIVHRLDKDTSGLIVVAKNDKSLEYLAKQWEDRTVDKEYIALVAGTVKEEKGAIEAPIGRSASDRKKMAVRTGSVGRDARTEFEVMQRFPDTTLLKVRILTGRTHQIRVHFASIGHPVIGDRTYGNAKLNAVYEEHFGLQRQFLHAQRLVFKMPSTKMEREFVSELPPELEVCLRGPSSPSLRAGKA